MKSNTIVRQIAAALLLVAILTGCTASPKPTFVMPTQDPKPTFEAIQTQAVQTAIAGLTQNAPAVVPTETALPATETPAATATTAATETSAPTNTPVVLPSVTPIPATALPTRTYVPWTATPPSGYGCSIISQSPAFGYDMPPGGDFDGKWTVKNTGTVTWDAGQIDIRYVAGTKFDAKATTFDLGSNVAKGKEFTVVIDMVAPKDPGRYTASWAIAYGKQTICPLNVTIDVVK